MSTTGTEPAQPPQPSQFGKIVLDISNSVLPLEKLSPTPSGRDGLSEEAETQIRSLGCDLIQIAGKLLRLPQVAMATGCVLFHRFFYAKSFVRLPFDIVAMAALGLACKIEESPRRPRDIINVFKHIKQVRTGRPIQPVILDANYINLKNQVIKAERRILKELGFCVHVKHPHKIIVMYLRWLEQQDNIHLVQMSWNFMNDSLRTDVFVRYPPETIAVACIYLSARRLGLPLPKNPAWFDVLGVEEDDIKDCCYRIICLYDMKKPNQEELEALVESLRRKMEESRRAAKQAVNTTTPSTPSRLTPVGQGSPNNENNGSNINAMDGGRRNRSRSPSKKRRKHHRNERRSSSNERDHRKSKNSMGKSRYGRSRSRSYSPSRRSGKKSHKDKSAARGYADYSRDGKNGSRHSSVKSKRRDEDRDYYKR